MAKEKLSPFTKKRFEQLKAAYEAHGYKVVSKWRRGLKRIRLADIVLSK